jgi:hypothetical protein
MNATFVVSTNTYIYYITIKLPSSDDIQIDGLINGEFYFNIKPRGVQTLHYTIQI